MKNRPDRKMGRQPAPTYRYAVKVFKGKVVHRATTILARNDDDAADAAQKLMQWEAGDCVTVEKEKTA